MSQVSVVFEPGGLQVEVDQGTTILAASQRAGIEILHGCTEGMCGTDPVRILEGAGDLSPAAEHEIGTLERMGLSGDYRLSCSARILTGRVRVETDTF